MNDKDIISSLRGECDNCSERGADGKCYALYYCANRDAADLIESLQSENGLLHAERDKAVEDLKLHGGCISCKHKIDCGPCKKLSLDFDSLYARCVAYEWRGEE